MSAILFLCLFAGQAGVIALSPVLAQVAADLDVSTAAAGQLRTISGLAAGVTALVLTALARRLGLRRLLVGGAVLLAASSVASAGSPTFAALALAQLFVGVSVAVLAAAAAAAAAEWAPPEQRARVLSWALIGNPAAWIVGMPLIGVVGESSWRYAWLVFPFIAAVAAACAAARGPVTAPAANAGEGLLAALRDPEIARWGLGELLATSAWVGLLVYSGALFTESYGASASLTGVCLAIGAGAFVAGNLTGRRHADGELRPLLRRLTLALAVIVPLVGSIRVDVATSAALFSAAAFVGGARTLLGIAVGLQAAPERRVALMAARTAANQFGYFVGSAVGGLALAASGYFGFGVMLGLLFAAAAIPLRSRRTTSARRDPAAVRPTFADACRTA